MGKPLRVLIVEDTEDDALLLVRELERGGYNLTYERVDNREAMAQALERQTWDIVLADHAMPHFSGLAALVLLREKGLDVPFLAVSGAVGEELAIEFMKAGAHDFIMKDNLGRLNATIERELNEAQVRQELKQAKEAATERSRELGKRVTELQAMNQLNLRLINERVHLIEVQNRRLEQFRQLHQVAQEFCKAASMNELLNFVASHLSQVVGSDFTSMVIIAENGTLLSAAETWKMDQSLEERARPGGLTRSVIATGKPICLPNYPADPRSNPELVGRRIKSWAGVPLMAGGKVKGVLIARSLKEDAFAEDMEVLQAFAGWAEVALRRLEPAQLGK